MTKTSHDCQIKWLPALPKDIEYTSNLYALYYKQQLSKANLRHNIMG